MKNVVQQYFGDKATILAWSGAGSFIALDQLGSLVGVTLSGIALVTSIWMQYHKVQSLRNEDRRKEELHQKLMQQKNEDNG